MWGRVGFAATLVSVVAFGSAAVAGEDVFEGVEDVVYTPPFSWSGFYIGGHIGGIWSDVSYNNVETRNHKHHHYTTYDLVGLSERVSTDASGFSGGLQTGLQRQYGNWVGGIELTASFNDLDKSDFAKMCGAYYCRPGQRKRTTEIGNLFTTVARLGWAKDRWMGYVKGGWARGEVVFKQIDKYRGFRHSSDSYQDGYALGGGFEYAIHKSITLAIDYTYVDLDVDDQLRAQIKFCHHRNGRLCSATNKDIDANLHQVTFRLNYKMGHTRYIAPPKG
ncbi:MAG: outer membrane protein [Hyphomicrobiaceae bacterium]